MGYIQSGSAQIYNEVYGSGDEILVLLHGNCENLKNFKHQVEYFKDKYTVLAIDSRGHGESTFGDGELSLNLMANDVINVIEDYGYKRVNILGFSDGANIAMIVAMRRPDLIDKLILAGGNLTPKGMKLGLRIQCGIAYRLNCWASRLTPGISPEVEYLSLMVKEPNITKPELKLVKAKTLVVAGDKDMIKRSETRAIAEGIENSRLEIMKGDHFIVYKKPDEFNKLVEEFLNA